MARMITEQESDIRSIFTILQPRDQESPRESMRLSQYYLDLMLASEGESFNNRKHFAVATLIFLLGLGNAWRFSADVFVTGGGAFVILYVLYAVTLGPSLLFFEVALGQYSARGYNKVFAMSPLFEGITYAMAFYGVVVNLIYNQINSYTVQYLILALSGSLPFKPGINGSATNEALFYRDVITRFDDEDGQHPVNVKNFGILFLIWAIILLCLLKRVFLKVKALYFLVCLFCAGMVYCVAVAIWRFGHLADALNFFFVPRGKSFANTLVWAASFEQFVTSLSIGIGPLITFGSYAKFRSPADRDCLIVNMLAIVPTLILGLTVSLILCGAAREVRMTPTDFIEKYISSYHDANIHVVMSMLFSRLPNIVAQLTIVITYLGPFWVSIFWGAVTARALAMLIHFNLANRKILRFTSLIIACIFSLLLSFVLVVVTTPTAIPHLYAWFIGTPAIFTVALELLAVIYIYGLKNYNDNIHLMIGFIPNIYYRVTWLVLPWVLLVITFYNIVVKTMAYPPDFMAISGIFMIILIVLPIMFRAVYNLIIAVMAGGCENAKVVLGPREPVVTEDQSDTTLDLYLHEMQKHILTG